MIEKPSAANHHNAGTGRRSLNRDRSLPAWTVMLAAAVLWSADSDAQTVDTNRPGFSFTPGIVPSGRWQLETGIAYDRPDSDSHAVSLPLAELRLGIGDGVEVFVSSLGWSDVDSGNSSANGLVDTTLGAKIALGDAGGRARMAFVVQVSAPIGDDELSSDRWDPSAAFVWTYDGALPLAGTAKVSKFAGGYQLDNGLKLPFTISDSQSGFIEWEANLPEGGRDAHWLNAGYQRLLSQTMQIDVNAGVGLNDRAGDYRLGLGFAILF
jgi:hypothetical protein